MKRGSDSKHTHESFFSMLIVTLVFATSVMVIFLRAPEQMTAMSQDGVMKVIGASGTSSLLHIEKLVGVEKSVSFFVAPVYEISMLGGGNVETASLQYRFSDAAKQKQFADRLSLFVYDPSVLKWKAISTTWDETTQTFFSTQPIHDSVLIALGITR